MLATATTSSSCCSSSWWRRRAAAPESARLILLALWLSAGARRAAAAALAGPKPAAASRQPRVEIRVEDFSFSDGVSKRPVIVIEATDMMGSEVSDALLAMAFDDPLEDEPAEDPFSHQNALLLVLCVFWGARIVLFGVASCWRLLQRALGLAAGAKAQDSDALLSDKEDSTTVVLLDPELELPRSEEQPVSTSERIKRQSALIRLWLLRFLALAEKLKLELSHGGDESAVGETVASLSVSQLDSEDVTLADVVRVLEQIPLEEHGLSTERIETQLAGIRQDVAGTSADPSAALQRLQELHASFQSVEHAVQSRKRAQSRQASRSLSLDSREDSSDGLAGNSVTSTSRTSRSASSSMLSSSNATSRELNAFDVLGELERVSRTLPQGFTADMFSSLGQAIRQQMPAAPTLQRTPAPRKAKCKAKRD